MHAVVVGAGLAGARAVEELRAAGHDGDITLVGAEPHRPYERPPLSKDVLLGRAGPEVAYVFDESWYADQQVSLRLGTEVVGLDPARRVVTLADGGEVGYDQLLLATGSEPRRLASAEGLAVPVSYLRTIEDSLAIRALWDGSARPEASSREEDGGPGPGATGARRLLVVGAGWIGLEVASAARQNDVAVTVVEPAELPLARVVGSEMGRMFADLHLEHGVDLRLSTTLGSLADAPGGGVLATLGDGSTVTADAVVVGIGV